MSSSILSANYFIINATAKYPDPPPGGMGADEGDLGGAMLTFAYGSNMNRSRMESRCPSACFVCIAVLRDHRLCFPRSRKNRTTGVAGVEACKDAKVWGVIYDISESDIERLDRIEGFTRKCEECENDANAYVRRKLYVHADNKAPMCVSTYMACPQENPPLPDGEYKQTIVAGAKYWGLPAEYIGSLEQIETA